MFYLKLFNKTLLTFDIISDNIDGQKVVSIVKNYGDNFNLLPIGLSPNSKSIMSWLKTRIIPKNRAFVDEFLSKNGLSHNDIKGILKISKGLSLNDCYWINENDDDKFEDYNLYENDFLKVLSLIAYTGYGSSKKRGFTSSPEFTTNGMLRKGWRRLDNKILLFKGGTSGGANTGNEPYSEFYVSQIARQMGLKHVEYNISKWKGCLCSTCELFTDINHSYVPIYRFVKEPTLRKVANYLKKLGNNYYNEFVDMLIFDALIFNEDRHFGNFGIMVNSKTNKPYAFAPIFDNGLSLFNYAMSDDINDLENYSKTRSSSYGVSFDNIVKEFIAPRQKKMLRKMIGFEFTMDKNYNLPKKRLKKIENFLQDRVSDMISMNFF